MLCTISDSQSLLALALAISFLVLDRCRILQYHFRLIVNIELVTGATYLLSLSLVRHHWKTRIAGIPAFVRFAAAALNHLFLAYILSLTNTLPFMGKRPYRAESLPPRNRSDSVLFLKASCFLDPDFQNRVFSPLSAESKESIGLLDNHGLEPECFFWLFLLITTGIAGVVRVVIRRWYSRHQNQFTNSPLPTTGPIGFWLFAFYWMPIMGLSIAVLVHSLTTVFQLRDWASNSGWLQPDERGKCAESDVRGFGQTAALATLVGTIIALLDRLVENYEENKENVEITDVKFDDQSHDTLSQGYYSRMGP